MELGPGRNSLDRASRALRCLGRTALSQDALDCLLSIVRCILNLHCCAAKRSGCTTLWMAKGSRLQVAEIVSVVSSRCLQMSLRRVSIAHQHLELGRRVRWWPLSSIRRESLRLVVGIHCERTESSRTVCAASRACRVPRRRTNDRERLIHEVAMGCVAAHRKELVGCLAELLGCFLSRHLNVAFLIRQVYLSERLSFGVVVLSLPFVFTL